METAVISLDKMLRARNGKVKRMNFSREAAPQAWLEEQP